MQAITDPQYNYLKGLIKKVSKEFYDKVRLNEKINPDLRERQLSKQQAQRLISQMKAKSDEMKAQKAGRLLGPFEIETDYGTVMWAETEERFLEWAEKRFAKDTRTLKKIETFVEDNSAPSLDVPGCKIKKE